jgi:hypothetical protein
MGGLMHKGVSVYPSGLPASTGSQLSFYLLGLVGLMPYVYTSLVLIVLASLLQIIGAWLGPETRHVDLAGALASSAHERETQLRAAPDSESAR